MRGRRPNFADARPGADHQFNTRGLSTLTTARIGLFRKTALAWALLAVALLPPIAGLTGDALQQPDALATGFHTATLVTAGLAVAGGVLAFATISNDVLAEQPPAPHPSSCALAGPPAQSRTTAT